MELKRKEAFDLVENTKSEICQFVKNFFEKDRPIIPIPDPFPGCVDYEINTQKYGKLIISLFKEQDKSGLGDWKDWRYNITVVDFNEVITPEKEDIATGDLYFGCMLNHPKLSEQYYSLGKAKFIR